jgi:hypothetical protein
MEQAAAVRGELATVRPQRLWSNALCQESEVVDCSAGEQEKDCHDGLDF